MATTERDKEICDLFLALAAEELANHATLRACDKAWDAVAHCVKSIARERGWPNECDDDLRFSVRRLIDHSSDPDENRTRFGTVEFYHINFFDDTPDKLDSRLAIADAKALIKVLNDVDSHMPR